MLRYAVASQFWRAVPVQWADAAWRRRVRRVSARAARQVPAYARLLRAFQPTFLLPSAGRDRDQDTRGLQTSRASYVEVFSVELRGRSGWQHEVVSFDSLGWGKGVSWPRSSDELRVLREQVTGVLAGEFDAHQRRTLLLVRLPEAGWSARRRILQALHEAIARGHLRASVVDLTCDRVRQDPAVARLINQFDQGVVLCEPQDAAGLASQIMGTIGRVGVVAFGAMAQARRATVPAGVAVCSVLGADEVGPLIGMETSLTRMIVQACESDSHLRATLLDGAEEVIGLYQPFPLGPSMEQVGSRLLVSSWGACPVIRYDLNLTGKVVCYKDICRLLTNSALQPGRDMRRLTRVCSACWKLPVIVVSRP